MPIRGQKPTPTPLRILRGNPSRKPLNKHEAQPKHSIPPPPKFLSKAAKKEYRRVARIICPLGLMTELDMPALAAYAETFARWGEAVEMVRSEGMMAVSNLNGHLYQSAYLNVANAAMKEMMRVAVEFGMTPSSRSRIVASGVGGKKKAGAAGNPYEEWKSGNQASQEG